MNILLTRLGACAPAGCNPDKNLFDHGWISNSSVCVSVSMRRFSRARRSKHSTLELVDVSLTPKTNSFVLLCSLSQTTTVCDEARGRSSDVTNDDQAHVNRYSRAQLLSSLVLEECSAQVLSPFATSHSHSAWFSSHPHLRNHLDFTISTRFSARLFAMLCARSHTRSSALLNYSRCFELFKSPTSSKSSRKQS